MPLDERPKVGCHPRLVDAEGVRQVSAEVGEFMELCRTLIACNRLGIGCWVRNLARHCHQ